MGYESRRGLSSLFYPHEPYPNYLQTQLLPSADLSTRCTISKQHFHRTLVLQSRCLKTPFPNHDLKPDWKPPATAAARFPAGRVCRQHGAAALAPLHTSGSGRHRRDATGGPGPRRVPSRGRPCFPQHRAAGLPFRRARSCQPPLPAPRPPAASPCRRCGRSGARGPGRSCTR